MALKVLNQERIRLGVNESTKKRTLEIIAELCAPKNIQGECLQALVEREKLGSTALGHGVALPHARVVGLDRPIGCFLQLKKPIFFEGPNEQPVDLIFGLLVPEAENDAHLKILSDVATVFTQSDVREALRHTRTSDEAFRIITQAKGDAALAS